MVDENEKLEGEELDETAVDEEQATDAADADDGDADDVSIAQIEKILNQEDANRAALPQNVKKMLVREAESSKRVEESIKGAKSNPKWFVPIFVVLLVLGLAWVVVNYITGGTYPIPGIGSWNLLIGFGIMLIGFIMTMWWN
jgi:hypothetical protein